MICEHCYFTICKATWNLNALVTQGREVGNPLRLVGTVIILPPLSFSMCDIGKEYFRRGRSIRHAFISHIFHLRSHGPLTKPVQVLVAKRVLLKAVKRLVQQGGRDDGKGDGANASNSLYERVPDFSHDATHLGIDDDTRFGDARLYRAVGLLRICQNAALRVALYTLGSV